MSLAAARSLRHMGLVLALSLLLGSAPLTHAASLAEQREAAHAGSFLKDGRAELAVSQCRQFRERFPSSALSDQILDMEGRAWLELERPAESLRAWQELALNHAASPLAPHALLAVGDCLDRLGRRDDAVRAWQRVAEAHPASAEAMEGLLRAEAKLAEPRATLALDPQGDAEREKVRADLLRRAMELDSDSEGGLEACRRWALLLDKQGRVEEARFLLQRVAREAAPGPLHLRALGELKDLELRDQRRDAALAVVKGALDDYEDSPLRSRLWIDLAILRMDAGDYGDALRGLEVALEAADPRMESQERLDSLRLLRADALAYEGRCGEVLDMEGDAARLPLLKARVARCAAVLADSSRAALAWAVVVDSLGASRREADEALLALALVELCRSQAATGLAAMPWEEVARHASRLKGAHPQLTLVAEELLRQGLAAEADPLLTARHDSPGLADRRGLLRVKIAQARGKADEARELVRIFRERWPASPLREQVELLAPPDMRPRTGTRELDLLLSLWERETPSPEDLRARTERLDGLWRESAGVEPRLAEALVKAWHDLREGMAAAGRDANIQRDCARRALAWGDSLREAGPATLMRLASAHAALGHGEDGRLLRERVLREHSPLSEALDAARILVHEASCDSSQRAELIQLFSGDWAWAPDAQQLQLALARQERVKGDPERGLRWCEALIQQAGPPLLPRVDRLASAALLESALDLDRLGQRDEARRRLLHAATMARGDSVLRTQALLLAARSFLKDDRVAEARAQAELAAKGSGGDAVEATRFLARLDRQVGQHEAGLARLEALNPGKSTDRGLRLQWVCALYRAGRAERGRPEFQRLMKESPRAFADTVKAVVNLEAGLALLAGGDALGAEKALQVLLTDLPALPQAAEAQLGLARSFQLQGKQDKAQKALAVVDARWPNSVEGAEASALRAAWAEAAGDASTALKASWQQVERSTQGPRQAALGAVADRAARLGRAADEQRALMLYREDYPFAQDGLARRLREARLLINAGEAAAARAQLRALQTEAVGEEAAELQYRLAEAAEAAGDLPGAVLEYEKTAHLDPPGGLDWGASALFQAARAWRELGREDAAEHSLREILRREGEDSTHGRRAKVELEALKGGEAK